MNGVKSLTAVAGVGSWDTGQTTDAIREVKVKPLTNAWRIRRFYHLSVRIQKYLLLTSLITLQILEGNVICDFLFSHGNVTVLIATSLTPVMVVRAEGLNVAHVSLGKLLDGNATLTLAFLVHHGASRKTASLRSVLVILVASKNFHVHFIVTLVAPVVFRARQSSAKQAEHGKHHIGGLLLGDVAELLKVDLLVLTEAQIENNCHFLKRVNTFLKCRCSTAFLGEFTFAITCGSTSYDGHTGQYGSDIGPRDELIVIEIVYVEHKLHLLIELRTVDA